MVVLYKAICLIDFFWVHWLWKFLFFTMKRHVIKHLKRKKRTYVYMSAEWAKIDGPIKCCASVVAQLP